jgi:hypothetical protein
MDSDLANEEAKIPVYYSVTKNTAFRIVCSEPLHCPSGKRHTFSHNQTAAQKLCQNVIHIGLHS